MKNYLFLIILTFSISHRVHAQESYFPVEVTGFNADCVVENLSQLSESSSIDANGWTFYSKKIREAGSFPDTDTTLKTSAGIIYHLQPNTGNNAFLLSPNLATSLNIPFSEPVRTSEVWLLGTSANGSNTIKITISYADGTTSSGTSEYNDWFQSSSDQTAVYGLARININSTDEASIDARNNFSLFDRMVVADSSKSIVNINISHISGSGYVAIFAISAFNIAVKRNQNYNFYLISNSHLDTQWNWGLDKTIGEYIPNTLDENFALFEKYPHFQFNFEAAIHYMWMKEYYPNKFEKLKEYVEQGRWHISGGSVNANDVMVPSAESVIRNFLYGQIFYKREFGRKGGGDVMLPDCFGFPYTLPTLAQHCGSTSFHTAKLAWGSTYDYDNLFSFGRWKGVDGAEVLALLKPGVYDAFEEFRKNLSYDSSILSDCMVNEQTIGVPSIFRYIGPRSDRGGGLDDETASWMEQSIISNGPVKVHLASPDTLFSSITQEERENLAVWNNELPMQTHGVGAYTSQAILKYWNRKNELMAGTTEKSSVVANWLGTLKYPTNRMEEIWTRILWHHHHDDITGTSIPKAYTYTYNDAVLNQLQLSETLSNVIGAVSRRMNTNTDGIPLVVYNPLSIRRTNLVEASLVMNEQPASLKITGPDGKIAESQLLDYDKNSGKLRFIFVASVPSLGFVVYNVESSADTETSNKDLKVTTTSLENTALKVTIDNNGDVSSVYDKKEGRELLEAPIRLALLKDVSTSWPAWEITSKTDFSEPYGYVDENVNITITENGPLRGTLKITRSKDGSDYVQYIRLDAKCDTNRIDFVNEVNWQTKGTLLKAVFSFTASNDSATYDLSIGTINRANSTANLYEVAGHQWADLSNNDNSYGISILNDCKYGWDKPSDNTLRLSLIHTPEVGNGYTYQRYQDLGLNKFTYSIYSHPGKWDENTQWEGEKLNQPILAFQTSKNKGSLGKSFSFASLNTSKAGIKALKKAEDSDKMIIRVYELTGEAQSNITIKFPSKVISAEEVNGIEEYVGPANFGDSTITFNIGRYQPKTFAFKLENPGTEADSVPNSNFVSLLYNIDVMSYDSDRTDGAFGTTEYSYPAGLLGDTLESDGIKFKIGSRANGQLNAVRCEGQTIELDNNGGANKKLYLLAASAQPSGSTANFKIDGESHLLKIGYFAGLAGQWTTEFMQGYYRKDKVAYISTHLHNHTSGENELYKFLYMLQYVIQIDKDVKKLILPDDENIIVFAATLSDNINDDATAVSEICYLPEFNDIETENSTNETCNPELTPVGIRVSGQTDDSESGAMAIDGDPFTKWCDNSSGDKWLEMNFNQQVTICQWQVIHAAVESEEMITSDFRLQKYFNGNWTDVDEVNNNTSNKTVRQVNPFQSSKVRLKIDQAEQNSKNASRIYEFNVYGTETTTDLESHDLLTPEFNIYPNPATSKQNITVDTGESGTLQLYSIQGVLLMAKEISGTTNIQLTKLTQGSYLARFTGKNGTVCKILIIK